MGFPSQVRRGDRPVAPTGLNGDNFGRPYLLHGDGLRGATDRAYSAPHTPFRRDPGFGFIPFHPDGVEHASLQAGLAAHAFFLVDRRLKAAGVEEFLGIGKALKDAAVPAAITDDVIDLLPVVDDMNQTFLLG